MSKYEAEWTHAERRQRRRQVIIDMKAGMTVGDCADKHGLSEGTIKELCRDHGIKYKRKPRERKTKNTTEETR
jgi:hypothetical protein